MKILYTNFHSGNGSGGHGTYVVSLARSLAGRHAISVAAPVGSALYIAASQVSDIQVLSMDFPTRFNRSWWSTWRRLRVLLRQERFDIVHVNGSADHRLVGAAVMGMGRARPRIVYTKHNDKCAGSLGNRLRAHCFTDRVICVCDYTNRMMQRTAYRQCGLRTVHNGIDTDWFAPMAADAAERARRQYAPQADAADLIIGSNAGTGGYKGWMDMVAAVASLTPVERERVWILLAGNLPNVAQRAEIEAMGMSARVTFTGMLQDVRPFIAALDMGFVLSYCDTLSFACREMMAMGKPVMLTDHGGLPENVSPGVDGWVVPKHRPAAVAQILSEVLNAPGLLAGMGTAARRKSQQEFRLERFVQDTEAVYAELHG